MLYKLHNNKRYQQISTQLVDSNVALSPDMNRSRSVTNCLLLTSIARVSNELALSNQRRECTRVPAVDAGGAGGAGGAEAEVGSGGVEPLGRRRVKTATGKRTAAAANRGDCSLAGRGKTLRD